MTHAKRGIMTRRAVMEGMAAVGMGTLPHTAKGQDDSRFTPEDFGARGDGQTNDSAAFRRMADAVNKAGGGRIVFRRTTYIVGEQTPALPGGAYSFASQSILRLSKCKQPLSIEGNGATLRCSASLRYGTFDRRTDRRVDLPMPTTQPGLLATPYDFMIVVEECRAPVSVTDLELDGSVGQHRIGGRWGDTGWQIPSDGLYLRNNSSDEVVRNVHTHHHARDGLIIAGLSTTSKEIRKSVVGVRSEWNGRQGASLISGHGYMFANCNYSHNGRGPVSSAPAAGFDVEAEVGSIRQLRFDRCVFYDNAGCGLVADSGDSADVHFADCRFIGTTNWSVWPNKSGFRFDRCEIVGACVRFFGSPNLAQATRFYDCTFTDAPTRSPSRKVYRNGPMANISDSRNVLFARCRFDAEHGAQLPWSTDAIYEDCIMQQNGATTAFPRGQFIGDNRISGAVDIASSRIKGKLILNGKTISPRP